MFKKFAIAVPMTLLALSASMAFAAEESRTSINITADIPSRDFHAMPVNHDFGKDERMYLDHIARTLTEVRGTFDIKHANGSVGAYVVGGPTPLFNGDPASSIPLIYTFNGKVLTATSQEVVGDEESNYGMRADLVISSGRLSDNHVGLYTANPVVMFDAIPRI
ncbi:adhesin [Pseudomonas sp.]|uniref:adhesin n=1 Tax=Pseudomonas sp. TaxID=306 RepID=UPI003F304CFF